MRTLKQSSFNMRLVIEQINRKYRNVEGLWHIYNVYQSFSHFICGPLKAMEG